MLCADSVPTTQADPGLDERAPDNLTACALHPHDRKLIEHLIKWAPSGGAPEDETFGRFGVAAHRLQVRISQLLSQWLPRNITFDDCQLLARAFRVLNGTDGWTTGADDWTWQRYGLCRGRSSSAVGGPSSLGQHRRANSSSG
jgi:hypothetical protein